MRTPLEKNLQAQLARRLDLVARDLRLVATEYPLPNRNGTSGRVDILARDGHGGWVVIEIKRSESSARQAVHEIMKYTELLCQEKGVRSDRIRAIVASTTWEELRVPVSQMARNWQHDLQVCQLKCDDDGVLVDAIPVDLLPAPHVPRASGHHFLYFFDSSPDRDEGWRRVVHYAAQAGAFDLLAADLHWQGERSAVRAPYALYFAIGQLAASDLNLPPEIDSEDDDPEYVVLCHITGNVFAVTSETGQPGLLRHMVENTDWRLESFRTAGAFDRRDLSEERDWLRELNGDEDGLGDVQYNGSARTNDRGRWPAFLNEYRACLASNPDWMLLVDGWLTDVSRQPQPSDVILSIYNPCDLVGALIHGWPGNLAERVPAVLGMALTATGPHRSIHGSLYWNKRPVHDPHGIVELSYPDPLAWMVCQMYRATAEPDALLVQLLGLQYILVEYCGANPHNPPATDLIALWLVRDDQACRIDLAHEADWPELLPLPYFLSAHKAAIQSLVTQYRTIIATT